MNIIITRRNLERLVRHVAEQHFCAGWSTPQKIDAIKMLREFTSLGLKESKDLIEAAFEDMKPTARLAEVLDAMEPHVRVG